jgi:hypothetical protein
MAPKEKISSVPVPFLDRRKGGKSWFRHVPECILTYILKVTHPEENTERLNIFR